MDIQMLRLVVGGLLIVLGLLVADRFERGGYSITGLSCVLIVVGLSGLFWNNLWNGAAPRWLWFL